MPKTKNTLTDCRFLDGDWCWDMDPFQVNDETKDMVLQNISFLLNQFIRCSCFENIIFGWVMHEQSTIDSIVNSLDASNCQIKTVSLVCDKPTLVKRLQQDIDNGIRTTDIIARSIVRLPLYRNLSPTIIDTTGKSVEQICNELTE